MPIESKVAGNHFSCISHFGCWLLTITARSRKPPPQKLKLPINIQMVNGRD